jgi:hypothetical protein
VRIAPQIGRLGYAYIKQPTPRGIITVEIKPDGASKKLFIVEIPPNMTADIVLPDGNTNTVGSGRWDYVLKNR